MQIALYDTEHRLVHFNDEYRKSAGNFYERIRPGLSLEEVLRIQFAGGNMPTQAIGHEDDWIANRCRRFGSNQDSEEFERSSRTFEIRDVTMPDGHIMIIVSEITERERVEEALRESEERFSAVFDNSPAAVSLTDTDNRFRLINTRFQKWFGVTQQGVLGKTPAEVLPRELANVYTAHDLRALEAGEATEREQETEFVSGQKALVLITKFPVLNRDGKSIGMGTIITDVSEERKTAAQLHQAQKMEAVGQLTGGIAHEFNNLLMVIMGNLEIAAGQVADSNAHKPLSSAMNGAIRAAELTSQLLAFSRKQILRVEHIDLNSLVRGIRGMLQQTLGETVSVNTELTDGIWPINADKSLLESALLNLSINARDAMPKGGRITITTTNRAMDAQILAKHSNIVPGDYVMLEVTDTGTGIASEILEHVFEPFFTTKDVGEGTGLGLSMVHGFVEQSGGFVDIESQVDKGTSIRVYLPREVELEENGGADEPRGTQVLSLGVTVLVVEDDPDVRQIVVGILSELGCNIVEAKDGRAAFSALARHPEIDVLFTDVVLPEGISGPDIAGEARIMMPKLKIVFTSGYPDGEVNNLGYDDENPWFIRKPYRKSELAELLIKVLQS
jgi:PAS domain S-box-containing protein